ncbi:transposase [Salmonella enterica subsp. enterica serovar Poona]|nr:transposase [Salmonella enterica subsp. enterica serovar Poona]HEB6949282.1 transposase [Salmonella enterica subsp. enterica serovar Hvittingfoss]
MNKRAWIHEALNLRFNKKTKINQISKQLNIPGTTLQSLLRRFARSGLSWPVPEECTPEHLERLLYPGTLRQQNRPASVAQETTPDVPVARRRPNFPPEFKRHLVELSMQPGANVARIAREHGICQRQDFCPLWGGGCFPGRFYCAMPSCRRYISGLSAPSDSLIRCSLYHRM